MDKIVTLNTIRHYYQNEYRDTERSVARERAAGASFDTINDTVRCALSRCLGVSFFVQDCGIEFKVIEKLYMEFYEKFRKLLDAPAEM
jgi:hypothetical protein